MGTTITWTATSSGLTNPVYRFSVGTAHGRPRILRDFSQSPSFKWTPMHEGVYAVEALVRDGFAATSVGRATATFTVDSRVEGTNAVVSPTANPLVALYSAPACSAGTLVVMFQPATGSTTWQSTAPQRCRAGQSVNVLIAGMRPSTRYILQHVVSHGKTSTTSPLLTFTTGKPPAGLKIPSFTVRQPAADQADPQSPATFHMLAPNPSPRLANPIATDLSGRLVWYYDTLHSDLAAIWPVHVISGGTVLLFGRDRYHSAGDDVLREVDLAGDTVRETGIDVLNAQLARHGQEPIYMFHHDALRLPQGDTVVLGSTQNRVGGHDVMGDMVIVLDTDFQVRWTWDIFDYFAPPATFPAGTLTCDVLSPLCGLPDVKAIDWSHGNGLGWSPRDRDLIVSFRNLSLVIKIDYRDGQGTGDVVWRLGKGGDFEIRSADPYPWFSQQHNATYVDATTMVIFDNGNTRCRNGKVTGCQSRGQVYTLDEQRHVATLAVNANLGGFWPALGSAQGLPNGDVFFAGGVGRPSKEQEIGPDGTQYYELDTPLAEYRAYRIPWLSL